MSTTIGEVRGAGGGDILFLVRIPSVLASALALVRHSLLSAHYLLNEWMDFGQTYTNLSLGRGKMLIRF